MTLFGLNIGDYEAYPEVKNHYNYINNVFLRGNLVKINGFDLIGADDWLFRILKTSDEKILDADIVLTDGSLHKARLFWWHDSLGTQHGLVCDINDEKQIKYAQWHFDQRAPHMDYNISKTKKSDKK